MLADKLGEVKKELEQKLGREVDLKNEFYYLQTPSALVKLGVEEDNDGERTLKFEVLGGDYTYVKTDNDIFGDFFVKADDNNA